MSALSNSSAKKRRARTNDDKKELPGSTKQDANDVLVPIISVRESIVLLYNRMHTLTNYIRDNMALSNTSSITDASVNTIQQSLDTLNSQVDTLNKSQSTVQLKQHINETELLALKEKQMNLCLLCDKLERRNNDLENIVSGQADFITKMQGMVLYKDECLDTSDNTHSLDTNFEHVSQDDNIKIETLDEV